MTEAEVWQVIDNDVPREWYVTERGRYYARLTAPSAASAIDTAFEWLREGLEWQFYRNCSERIDVAVRCGATDEYARETRVLCF